jgi:hypothetical protein
MLNECLPQPVDFDIHVPRFLVFRVKLFDLAKDIDSTLQRQQWLDQRKGAARCYCPMANEMPSSVLAGALCLRVQSPQHSIPVAKSTNNTLPQPDRMGLTLTSSVHGAVCCVSVQLINAATAPAQFCPMAEALCYKEEYGWHFSIPDRAHGMPLVDARSAPRT